MARPQQRAAKRHFGPRLRSCWSLGARGYRCPVAQPPRDAQQPVARDARGARGGARRTCGDADTRVVVLAAARAPVLRRPRPQGADVPPQRCRRRARVLCRWSCAAAPKSCRRSSPAEAGDRGGRGRRHGCGLPARRHVRSRRGRETARFCTPGVDIGLFCSTPMVALSRNVPRKVAMEMLPLGEMLSGRRCRALRPRQRVVPEGEARGAALELAGEVAAKSPRHRCIGKAAFYRQIEVPLAEAYGQTCEVMVANMMKADAAEGIGAFLEQGAHPPGSRPPRST